MEPWLLRSSLEEAQQSSSSVLSVLLEFCNLLIKCIISCTSALDSAETISQGRTASAVTPFLKRPTIANPDCFQEESCRASTMRPPTKFPDGGLFSLRCMLSHCIARVSRETYASCKFDFGLAREKALTAAVATQCLKWHSGTVIFDISLPWIQSGELKTVRLVSLGIKFVISLGVSIIHGVLQSLQVDTVTDPHRLCNLFSIVGST